MSLLKNKRGMGQVLGMFLLIFLLLALAFGGAILVSVTNNIMDEFKPVVDTLGDAGGTNLTQTTNYVFTPLNTITNSFNWILGAVYAFSLFMIIALAISYRATGEKYLVVLFLLLLIIGIFISISMSNAYEDLSTGTDSFATGLQDQTLLSWLIINSPLILVIISLIGGAIMFTANPEEQF